MTIETHQEKNPHSEGQILPVLIDADIISYQVGFSKEVTDAATALSKTRDVVDYIKHNAQQEDFGQFHFYLTGRGNFRNDYAVTAQYKANRSGRDKPEFLELIRGYLRMEYDAIVTEGRECDDAIATHAASLNYNCIAASIDKDFLQIPCWHFNFRRGEWYKPTEWEGLQFFYSQILTGDAVDNIIGLKGIGPKKAEKALKECTTVQELYKVCVDMYDGSEERVLENGRLLWLQRYEGQIWESPA